MIAADRYGPWAVIAGGSEGVGAAFAEQLAASGINVALIARNPATLAATAQAIRAAHPVDVRTAAIDLTTPGMVEAVRAATAGLDVGFFVYNAGAASGPSPLIEQPAEEALQIIRLNTIGQTLLSQHFGARMAKRGRGALVLIGSLGCIAGCKNLAVYSAVKAYTQTFAEGLWAELRPHGVEVAALMIGRTRTPALERSVYGADSTAAVAEPGDVVRYALDNIAEGPVLVPPEHQAGFAAMRAMPRRKAVEIMTRSLEPQTAAR